MNFFNIFEDRVAEIFGASRRGFTAPFSFKKLAKAAAHEMENETFVISGVDTAPALYTVLVSPTDDSLMRPIYGQLTVEVRQFIEAQAMSRGYSFIGEPLVRFMVDPSLRSGRFSVFAENVDMRTLARLREEEDAYLRGSSSLGGAANAAAQQGRPQAGLTPIPERNAPAPGDSGSIAGLDVIPATESEPAFVLPQSAPERDVPLTQRRPAATEADSDPYGTGQMEKLNAERAAADAARRAAAAKPASCILIDRQSGRTYTAEEPHAIIGRERTPKGIVLRDPNVSRRHAELSYEDGSWYISDLNSTNGTLVNDVDVDRFHLRDGDIITLGLMNLEFHED